MFSDLSNILNTSALLETQTYSIGLLIDLRNIAKLNYRANIYFSVITFNRSLWKRKQFIVKYNWH